MTIYLKSGIAFVLTILLVVLLQPAFTNAESERENIRPDRETQLLVREQMEWPERLALAMARCSKC